MAMGAMILPQIVTAQSQPTDGGSQPYQPSVPAGNTVAVGGYYPGSYGGGTVAGSAMNGMANAISAMGSYNLSTSAAAVNMTQARRNSIENSAYYTDTYFQMRASNRAYREAERGPRPTADQLARLARDGAPKPLSPSDLNSVNGAISWPPALQQESFAQERAIMEQISATKAAHGSLSISDQMAARKTVETMFADLKSQLKELPPQEYMASRNFLRSLNYATTRSDL
jgi:hypothetical protein